MKKLTLAIFAIFEILPLFNFGQPLNFTIYDKRTFGDNPWFDGSPIFDKNGDLWIRGGLSIQPASNALIQYDGVNWIQQVYPDNPNADYLFSNAIIDSSDTKWFLNVNTVLLRNILISYDGSWKTYWLDSIFNQSINLQAIAIDSNQTKWLLGGSDIVRLNGFNATHYDCTSILGLPFPSCDFNLGSLRGLSNYSELIALGNNNTVWFGTGVGLLKYDGVSWQQYSSSNSGLPNDTITTLAVAPNGNLWIGTFNAGLIKFDGTTWTQYLPSNSGLKSLQIRALAISPSGDLWVGTQSDDFSGYNLVRYNGSSWTSYDVTDNSFPNYHSFNWAVRSISFAPSGKIWLTSFTGLATTGIPTSMDDEVSGNIEYDLIDIYPNPANSYFIVSLKRDCEFVSLMVTDVLGKEIEITYMQDGDKVLVNTAQLDNGTYFIVVQTNEGIVRKTWQKNSTN